MLSTTGCIRRPTAVTLLFLVGLLTPLPAQRDSLVGTKSPSTALALSLGATALPYVVNAMANRHGGSGSTELAMFAILAGPAVGHFYAGQPNRALTGMVVRAGLLGATALLAQGDCEGFLCIPPGVIIGGLALTAAMIVDIAAAPGSARKFNSKHARVAIVPLQDGPHTRLGVGMQVRF